MLTSERDRLGRLGSPDYRIAVSAVVAGPRWIFDGFPYYMDGPVFQRADLIVALDYPRRLVMWRVLRRSVALVFGASRGAHRAEGPRAWLRSTHPLPIAWSRHGDRRKEIDALAADPLRTAEWIRHRTPGQTDAWSTA